MTNTWLTKPGLTTTARLRWWLVRKIMPNDRWLNLKACNPANLEDLLAWLYTRGERYYKDDTSEVEQEREKVRNLRAYLKAIRPELSDWDTFDIARGRNPSSKEAEKISNNFFNRPKN